MAGRGPLGKMGYERVFQALGRLVDERRMRDVIVMEFEEGVILQGFELAATTEDWVLRFKTETFGEADLKKLVDKL
jgi:hypothetical protein